MRITLKKRSLSRRRYRGVSLVETMVAVTVFSILMVTMTAGLRALALGASQQVTDTGMGFDARRGVDEMLAQMRYASGVVAFHTSPTKTYTTNGSTIVMQAAGYDPAAVSIILPGVTDYIIFEHDAVKKEIRETVIAGVGSKRVARSRYLLAKNVESIALTYRVRDQFEKPISGVLPALSAKAVSAPSVTVNGESSSGAWALGSPSQIQVSAGASGADVQVLYPVSASDADALGHVQQVDVAVNFSDIDSRKMARKLTMSGSVCLRNHRD